MWQRVGSMPHRRVMGDAVVLCDGTIGIFNGAGAGLAVRVPGEGLGLNCAFFACSPPRLQIV